MKRRPLQLLRLAPVLTAALALTGCDQGVGVTELLTRTAADGTELEPLASCILMSGAGGDSVSGGGSGPEYAIEVISDGETVLYRYYIAKEANVGMGLVTPDNGELAAEIEADGEFFESDEVKTVAFSTYDGLAVEVFVWGQDDCEGDLPHEPPAQ